MKKPVTKKFASLWKTLTLAVPLAMTFAGGLAAPAQAQQPAWLGSAVIYCVNPEIFSTTGLPGVTSQLSRLQNLGVNTIWLMPFSPRGQACTVDGISHNSINSPYCMSNMEGIASNMGTSADLTNLVNTAHGMGMRVILDVALNQTSWDNPLVTNNPQYYLHSDGNPNNVASIEDGWGQDTDIAQFNLTTDAYGAQTYVTNVCKYWLTTYNFDGFRFDTADNPSGTSRSLPQSLMQSLKTTLTAINPNILMLGEEENVQIALAPYGLDYGWNMYDYGIVAAFTQTNNASTLQYQWQYPYTINNTSPSGMLHMNLQDDWDKPNRDIAALGGYPQALAAAVFDFTISGVPLLYNGMEVANTNGGINSHTQINWNGTNSTQFTTFYKQLLALRNNSGGALQQGTTTWITNSSAAVTAYDRTGGGQEYLVEINTNAGAVSGTISTPSGAGWSDVTPAGAPGGTSHVLPSTGSFSLQGYDFAVFKRVTSTPVAATPTFSPAPGSYTGSVSVTLSDATSGAALYYTVNGSTPTTASTKYTGAISVSSTQTIKAIAAASGVSNSSVASGTYTISGAEGPYGGTAAAIPGTIQAENYDTGGQGVGYSVGSVNGSTNSYRADGVDLETCSDTNGGYDVGWSAAGQWFRYTVNVATAGTYTVSFRVASGASSGGPYTFHLQNSAGTNLTGSITVPYTGGWGTWTTVTGSVVLPAGRQVLTLFQDTGGYNVNLMTFTPPAASGSLSGALTTVSSAQAFNLTTLGTTDWGAWGYNGFDHSASGGGKISNVAVYGGGSLNSFTSSFLGSTWTNGTPDASVSNETKGYYNAGGVGDGFTFTAPASTSTQTLTVFVGGWATGGTLTATLSDGSAPAYTSSSLSNSGNSYYGYYTLTYKAASANQTLTVVWKEASGTGNVTLYSAALH